MDVRAQEAFPSPPSDAGADRLSTAVPEGANMVEVGAAKSFEIVDESDETADHDHPVVDSRDRVCLGGLGCIDLTDKVCVDCFVPPLWSLSDFRPGPNH